MNDDIRQRLARANELAPPDVWNEARARARLGAHPIPPGPALPSARARLTAGVLAFAVFLLAAALGWSALRPRDHLVATPGGSLHRTIEVYEPSGSMLPTIAIGQTVVVDIDAYVAAPPTPGDIVVFDPTPARGDIIAFTAPDHPDLVFLKRVIGLPGDTVNEVDGVVTVNGTPLDEPYTIGDKRTLGPWVVEQDHLFVMGDNRPNSNDSRFADIGQIPLSSVSGRVLLEALPSGSPPAPPTAEATSVG
jgi:signal peptidase I